MTFFDYALAVGAAWAILAALGGFSWAFVVTRLKRRHRPVRISGVEYPPPVWPRVTQADIDATHLAFWLMDDDVTRLAFDQIISAEGLQ